MFGFSLCCWLIPCTFGNKQTEGIILSNQSARTVAIDKEGIKVKMNHLTYHKSVIEEQNNLDF